MTTSDDTPPPPAQAAAARELTGLLDAHPVYSFVRLGDGEVQWMQFATEGRDTHRYRYEEQSAQSVELVRGVTGMEPRHLERFRGALHDADYVDFCDSIPAVSQYLAAHPIARRPDGRQNPSRAASNLMFAWTWLELGNYLRRHRCLFAGAEASLLEALWREPEFRTAAREVIPPNAKATFHQVRENGRRYSENLDLIKADLIAAVRQHQADTLFLSLASGAKILCVELATECGIRAIDFGSMMRGLSYAGSSGYQTHRDMHHPFFYFVPFATHLRAVEQAFPALTPAELAGKAYAQLALELHRHRRFQFNTSDGVDGGGLELTPENLARFHTAHAAFRREWWPRWKTDPAIRQLDREFRHWLRKHGIGWQGFWFRRLVQGKQALRRLGLIR